MHVRLVGVVGEVMHRTPFLSAFLFSAALAGAGCSGTPATDDAGASDAGAQVDARAPDGGGGGDGAIPGDAFVPLDAVLAQGAACGASSECATGHCVDGVCCESACDGVCRACAEASTGAPDGRCSAALAIDPDDECDASGCLTGACGASACEVQPAGFECRPVAGDCDVPEVCDGSDPACPADLVRPAETACRASVGLCDLEEQCDGLAAACPADALAAASTPCRVAAGVCDVTEVCSGSDPQCPSDGYQPPSAAFCGAYTCNGPSCRTSCATQTDCYGNNLCVAGACVPGYRIFVTSQRFQANFGGVFAADALCAMAGTSAGLGPNFRAWLSDATSQPATRLYHSPRPYYRVDGVTPRVIANDWNDLVDGIAVAIASDELGNPQRDEYVWTGTLDNGLRTGIDCAGWTSVSAATTGTSGNATAALFSTYYGAQNCSRAQRLYCVEQPPPS